MSTFKPEQRLHPEIRRAVDEYDAARKLALERLAAAQLECKHERVAEAPNDNGSTNPRRICLRCALEEIGTLMSGGSLWTVEKPVGQKTVLGNESGRDVMLIDWTHFYKLRVVF